MAESIGYAVAVLMMLLGVGLFLVSLRASLRSEEPGGGPEREPVDEGRLAQQMTV